MVTPPHSRSTAVKPTAPSTDAAPRAWDLTKAEKVTADGKFGVGAQIKGSYLYIGEKSEGETVCGFEAADFPHWGMCLPFQDIAWAGHTPRHSPQ